MAQVHQVRRAVAFGLATLPFMRIARAADAFPAKPIRLVVPFPAGGSTDILARILSKQMFTDSRQPVVVDNVAGAGGNIGAQAVVRAAADGYTLEVGAMSQHAINGLLYKGLSFDPMADFSPIAMLGYATNVIAVSSKVPVNNFSELIAYIRANPGKLNYSSGGIGSHNHLTLALLAKTANLDYTHVPYKGGGPAVLALAQGEVDIFAGGASLLAPQARGGRVKMLAVTESKRSELLPELPTVSETVPGFEVSNWYGLFGRRTLDPNLIRLLNEEIDRVMRTKEVADQLRTHSMFYASNSPAELERLIQQEHALWRKTISDLKITVE